MPTYHIRNKNTDEVYEEICSYEKLQDFLKENPHFVKVVSAPKIVSSVATGLKNDDGWNENMARIAEAHPDSPLAERYGEKSIKQIKTNQVLKKHGLIK